MDNYITQVDIKDESTYCFLTYAEEVLTDRAVPNVEDGLLSSHRKILWTSEEVLKLNSKSKYKKSASIIGTTLSTSYFHGDAACYGAMCKLAQQYLMRYPLIDGDGNLGSQEGNGMEAAARYTNARPSIYADLLFNDFKKNVVPLKETYNGEYMEPVYLPGLFPNAIVNGREAIGLSMSHSSLPHNLTEVCNAIIAMIKNKDITLDEILEIMPGPDFPLGGIIINQKDIKENYRTGHDKTIKVRGDYEIKGNQIIFTSIPYRTYRNKIKEQFTNNLDKLEKYFDDFNDESNVGKNRLVFDVKKGMSPESALLQLFKLTDLQTSVSYNMNFIVNGTPKMCSMMDLIKYYIKHQNDVMVKAAIFDKEKAEKRIHILEGLLKAVDKINEVIELIKSASDKEEAKNKLINFLEIDNIQANAILEMKLGRLTKINKQELVDELKEKEKIVEKCNLLINDSDFRNKTLIEIIEDLRNKYGDKRRTKIENLQEPKDREEKEIAEVVPEKCIVSMTEDGYIKRIPVSSFRTQRKNGKGVKSLGDITSAVIRTNTIDSLMIFTDKGKMYRLLVDDVPVGNNTSKGQNLRMLISMETNENPVLIYSIYRNTEAKYVLFTTKLGMVKKTPLDDYVKTKKKTGITAITIREDDALASVSLVNDEDVILLTRLGMGIRFKSSAVGTTSRVAIGVKGINLKEGDYVVSTLPIRDENDTLAIFSEKGLGKKIKTSDLPPQNRGGKGLITYKAANVVGGILVSDEDNILILGKSNSICISAKDIPLMSRASMGNQMIKSNEVVNVCKV